MSEPCPVPVASLAAPSTERKEGGETEAGKEVDCFLPLEEVAGELPGTSGANGEKAAGGGEGQSVFRRSERKAVGREAKREVPPLFGEASEKPRPEGELRCYGCGANVPYRRKDSSVPCRKCGEEIRLEAVEVRDQRREDVKTRGELTIHPKASLVASEIACGTLRVFGKISGAIDCQGDAYFTSSGMVVGRVRCRHLWVHRQAEVVFVPGVWAETAEVHGRVEGDLICEGRIRIAESGAVLGDCTAAAIQLECGGVLTGQMKIVKPGGEGV